MHLLLVFQGGHGMGNVLSRDAMHIVTAGAVRDSEALGGYVQYWRISASRLLQRVLASSAC